MKKQNDVYGLLCERYCARHSTIMSTKLLCGPPYSCLYSNWWMIWWVFSVPGIKPWSFHRPLVCDLRHISTERLLLPSVWRKADWPASWHISTKSYQWQWKCGCSLTSCPERTIIMGDIKWVSYHRVERLGLYMRLVLTSNNQSSRVTSLAVVQDSYSPSLSTQW